MKAAAVQGQKSQVAGPRAPAPAAQLPLPAPWADALSLVDRFEKRLRDLRMIGLTLWTLALRQTVQRLFANEQARRAKAYEQLMLLEHEIESARMDPSTCSGLLVRLGQAKGALAVLMLGLFLGSVATGDVTARGLRRGRRRDEICLIEEVE